jgi:hypothetical protein
MITYTTAVELEEKTTKKNTTKKTRERDRGLEKV